MQGKKVHTIIGCLTPELSDEYEAGIWRGIEHEARKKGYGVISFLGSHVKSPVETDSAANIVYELATKSNIDGLVIISAAIATYLDSEGLAAFFGELGGIPAVSIGVHLPGVSSVTVDGSESIARLIHHLAVDHHRRRFALITGPRQHQEVGARETAIAAALRREGIELDERLRREGQWFRSSGSEAAVDLLESGIPFDALLCMNDTMAVGAIRALRGAGRKVPEEISVVGFDGIQTGKELLHPLTTIVQPLFELGVAGVDALSGLLSDGAIRGRVLGCELSINESCGCPPQSEILSRKEHAAPRLPESRIPLLGRLGEHIASGDGQGFVAEVHRAAVDCLSRGEEPSSLQDVLSVLAERLSAAGKAAQAESFLDAARGILSDMRVREQTIRRAEVEERFEELRSVSASLAGSFEIGALLEVVHDGLVQVGIGEGFLALFESETSHDRARLVLAPESVEGVGTLFPTNQLLPAAAGAAWRERQWVLDALVFQDQPLGYMLLPSGYDVPAFYDSVKGQVSSALKGALLLDQVRRHERTLEAEVNRRTRELTRANADLKEEIERRVRLESEVVDISNRTMERIGQDLHDDLCQHLAGIAMLASVAEKSLAQAGRPEAQSITRVCELLEGSISRVKQIARGLIPTGLEAHGLPAAIEDLVESARKTHGITIDYRASPRFALPDTDRALQIYRIVQEALSNAVKHSGSSAIVVTLGAAGRERLARADGEAKLLVEVRDSGRGIPADIRTEGMGLRIMRYRAEKAGLDLKIEPGHPGTRVICTVTQNRKSGR